MHVDFDLKVILSNTRCFKIIHLTTILINNSLHLDYFRLSHTSRIIASNFLHCCFYYDNLIAAAIDILTNKRVAAS